MLSSLKKFQAVMAALANWLLEDSVSFTKLDSFRRQLMLEVDGFARLLGVTPDTYKTWRRTRNVPPRYRDSTHALVVRQTPRNEAELRGLARALSGVEVRPRFRIVAPSRTTPRNVSMTWSMAPHLYMPL
jgi:DNA-binding transcriptional regulator YiaG